MSDLSTETWGSVVGVVGEKPEGVLRDCRELLAAVESVTEKRCEYILRVIQYLIPLRPCPLILAVWGSMLAPFKLEAKKCRVCWYTKYLHEVMAAKSGKLSEDGMAWCTGCLHSELLLNSDEKEESLRLRG